MVEKLTLFIVEDNAFLREAISLQFQEVEGLEVRGFAGAEDCLRSGEIPDLMIVDYYLSGGEVEMNGRDLWEHLRDLAGQIPAIFYSGQREIEVAMEIIRSGAYDYLDKNSLNLDLLVRRTLQMRDLVVLERKEAAARKAEKTISLRGVLASLLLAMLLIFLFVQL